MLSDEQRRALIKDSIFLEIANKLGALSTCDRANIGAVVTKDGRCVAWGYNGAPPGLPHCDENAHGWALSPENRCVRGSMSNHCILENPESVAGNWVCECGWEVKSCRNATHAEANALAAAAKQGISTDGGTLFVSQSPCLDCSRLIIAAGIVRVVYDTMYRVTDGLELLRTAGVEVAPPEKPEEQCRRLCQEYPHCACEGRLYS